MRLVSRRARRARGLLAAAAVAALLAVVLLTALSVYGGQVTESGARAAVAAAPAEERSLLLSGSVREFGDAATLDRRVRAVTADGLGGARAQVRRAGYAVGQQLPTGLGDARPGEDGLALASVMFLEDLPAYADLVSGAWPRTGGKRIETALAAPVAKLFGVAPGDEIPLTDRRTDAARRLVVTGVWQPRDPADPYWRLAPDVATGSTPGGATYGPLVIERADFARHFGDLASVSWLVTPDLSTVTVAQLREVRQAAGTAGDAIQRRTGDRLEASTRLDELTARLARSAVVANSTLLAPALLLALVAGYALLLVAGLLADQRRAENALLRARGAGSWQVARLTAAEALLVVAPALLLGAPLASGLLWLAARTPWFAPIGLRLDAGLTPGAWLVAAAASLGCALALAAPSLRRGATYVAEQQAKSRPARRGVIQRAGIDLALVLLAVLAWTQLRQYGSPLLGLSIDPMLVAAPTLGVLAATVAALRLLPWITRAGQHAASRRQSFAALLGAWQAGRRPHAGAVLLISLAVGVATLAIGLQGTSQRSLTDQASHRAGADLRLVEVGAAPYDRASRLASLPGVTTVLPAVRDSVTVGAGGTADVLMLDAARAVSVLRPRADLTDQPAGPLFRRLADSRAPELETPLPRAAATGQGRLTGRIAIAVSGRKPNASLVRAWADVRDRHGVLHQVEIAETRPGGPPVRIDAALPEGAAALYGFRVDATLGRDADLTLTWSLRDLAVRADGDTVALDLSRQWRVAHTAAKAPLAAGKSTLDARPDRLTVTYPVRVEEKLSRWSPFATLLPFQFDVQRPAPDPGSLGALATPAMLAEIGGRVGSEFQVRAPGGELTATVTGVIDAIPGVANDRAVLLDLPAAVGSAYLKYGSTLRPNEWRLAVRADQHRATARQLAALGNTETLDRRQVTPDPLGAGARLVLLPAALAVALLAALGIAVDARATARSRAGELAVLHTMGSPPRLLARALVAEQAVLAGLGVAAGLVIGVLVAWTMGPLLVLTPEAARPVPDPVLVADPILIGVPVAGLLLVAVGLAGAVAARAQRNLAVVEEER